MFQINVKKIKIQINVKKIKIQINVKKIKIQINVKKIKIQRCRKYTGLHPWDTIKSYYSGEPKYNLEGEIAQECISQITKVKLEKYTENKVFYEKKFDDLDIKLFIDVM
jgi:hypothetical protein